MTEDYKIAYASGCNPGVLCSKLKFHIKNIPLNQCYYLLIHYQYTNFQLSKIYDHLYRGNDQD